jgi:hypothetical protein
MSKNPLFDFKFILIAFLFAFNIIVYLLTQTEIDQRFYILLLSFLIYIGLWVIAIDEYYQSRRGGKHE